MRQQSNVRISSRNSITSSIKFPIRARQQVSILPTHSFQSLFSFLFTFFVALSYHLVGYDCIVFNRTISDFTKLTPKDANQFEFVDTSGMAVTQQTAIRTQTSYQPTSATSSSSSSSSFSSSSSSFRQYSRLTLVLTSLSQIQSFSSSLPILHSYDFIAVQPTTESLFHAACNSDLIDIITFDLTHKSQYHIKRPAIHLAFANGLYFEMNYGSAIRDSHCRRYLFQHSINLLRMTGGGKNVLLSSGAAKALELRDPYEIQNLGKLLGMDTGIARAAVGWHAESCWLHAQTRKTFKAVVKEVKKVESVGTKEKGEEEMKSNKESVKEAGMTDVTGSGASHSGKKQRTKK